MIFLHKESQIKGVVSAPPSKSAAHRAIIAAALSSTECTVNFVSFSQDIKATINAFVAMGKEAKIDGEKVSFSGNFKKSCTIDCHESGSTFRFLLPIVLALGIQATFLGQGKLPERPYKVLAQQLIRKGAKFSRMEGMPVTVSGKLKSGIFQLPGNVSSQYITALLFALPMLDGKSEVVLTSPLQSKGYVDLTLSALAKSQVKVQQMDDRFVVCGNQKFRASKFDIEGDYSNGAFWMALGALNEGLIVKNLRQKSKQGDKEFVSIMKQMGAKVFVSGEQVTVAKSSLKAIEVDVSQIPDLAPILSVLMAAAEGTSKITNASRLRIKECDRLQAIVQNLSSVGVSVKSGEDWIEIQGGKVVGGKTEGFNDHRIVMSMAVLSTISSEGIETTTPQATSKSYPDFFDKFRKLGGKADEFNNRQQD